MDIKKIKALFFESLEKISDAELIENFEKAASSDVKCVYDNYVERALKKTFILKDVTRHVVRVNRSHVVYSKTEVFNQIAAEESSAVSFYEEFALQAA